MGCVAVRQPEREMLASACICCIVGFFSKQTYCDRLLCNWSNLTGVVTAVGLCLTTRYQSTTIVFYGTPSEFRASLKVN